MPKIITINPDEIFKDKNIWNQTDEELGRWLRFMVKQASGDNDNYLKNTISSKPKQAVTTKTNTNDKYTPEFLMFWDAYPYCQGNPKQAAFSIWPKAIAIADFEKIISGAKTYSEYIKNTGSKIAHARTWLNQQRWDSDYSDPVDFDDVPDLDDDLINSLEKEF